MTVRGRARVGLIGAGWWGTHMHLPALVANPDALVVGVCDLDGTRAREVADHFGVRFAVDSVDDLLALGVDAVIVATPHDAHFEPAAAAIAAGAHVLVEKPMTLDANEAWDLVARAKAANVPLHVGHTYPYSRHAAYLRAAIRRGDLGELNLTTALFSSSVHQFYSGDVDFMQRRVGALYATGRSTYSDAGRGGGHLFTQITHAASVVLWVTERAAARVAAFEHRGGFPVDLADGLAVTFDDGSVATMAGTGSIHEHPFRVEEYRFFGSNGRALLNTASGTLDVALADGPIESPPLAPLELDLSWRTSAALVATAQGRQEVVVPGELGASVVDLLSAARQSSDQNGAPVCVPNLPSRADSAKEPEQANEHD
jgi:predicted dehydrogenase